MAAAATPAGACSQRSSRGDQHPGGPESFQKSHHIAFPFKTGGIWRGVKAGCPGNAALGLGAVHGEVQKPGLWGGEVGMGCSWMGLEGAGKPG